MSATDSSTGPHVPAWRAAIRNEGGWILLELWRQLRATGMEVRRRPWLATTLIAVAIAAAAWAGFGDRACDTWARAQPPDDPLLGWARMVRTFGAFTDVLTWSTVLYLAGRLSGRERWRRAGVACLLAASLAGILSNLVRPTLGRARPDANAGVFVVRGPTMTPSWQSLPSGHTATSTGGAVALVVLAPPLGALALTEAVLVGASSVRLNRHWLSDVVGGFGLGITAGVFVILAWRRSGS